MDGEAEHSYGPAIGHLSSVLEILNRPGEGLGTAWGLRPGQVGFGQLVRARDQIERLQRALIRHERSAA